MSVIAPDYKKQGATVIPPELKYVEVISVTASSGYDANTGEQKEKSKADERELPSTVTLLVTPEHYNYIIRGSGERKGLISDVVICKIIEYMVDFTCKKFPIIVQ